MSEDAVDPAMTEGLPDCGEDLRQVEFPLTYRIRLSAEAIVKGLGDSAPRDVYDLILGLEKEIGWWALTILLGRYFAGQMEVATRECPDLISKTDGELLVELVEGE